MRIRRVVAAMVLGMGLAPCISQAEEKDAPVSTVAQQPVVIMENGTPGACGDCCQSCWSLKVNVLYLQRAKTDNALIIQDTVTGAAVLTSSQFNFDFDPGWDISGTYWINNCWGIDARYFEVNSSTSTVTGTTSPIFNFPTNPPLFGLGTANFVDSYTTRMHSAELNGKYRLTERINLLAGFRYVNLDETLTSNLNFGGNAANIPITAHNDLYGGQIGAEGGWMWGKFGLDVRGTAGIYGNHADSTLSVNQQIGPAFQSSGSGDHAAFVGDLSIAGVYQVTRHIYMQLGYQLMWVDGVALAPHQYAGTNVVQSNITVNTGGTIFYHGGFAGLGFKW